jgi:HEAT repeat protein
MRVLAQASRTDDPELASTAVLGLGNAAMRLRDRDAAGAAGYVDDLLARLRAATDDGTRMTLLRALGNTGDARILPALQAAFASDAELVRAAAVEALRFVPGVEPLVIAALRDHASAVRTAAVFAAGFGSLDKLVGVLAETARVDPDTTVRRSIVELAGARMKELPALRAIVEHAAANDADTELRDAARGMLAR